MEVAFVVTAHFDRCGLLSLIATVLNYPKLVLGLVMKRLTLRSLSRKVEIGNLEN